MKHRLASSKITQLVQHWLYNYNKHIINKEVLLVVYKGFDAIDEAIKEKYNIVEFHKYQPPKTNNIVSTGQNIILLGNNKILISNLKKIQNKILFICFPSQEWETFEQFLNSININAFSKKPELSSIEKHIYYIEQNNPIEIIQKHLDTLESFLFHRFTDFWIKDARINNFLKNTNLETEGYHLAVKAITVIKVDDVSTHTKQPNGVIFDESFQKEYLKRDIAILKEKGILTSRLSIVIYRNAHLDISANVTEIGLYFSKSFGKSKAIDLNSICKGTSVDYHGLSKTIVKAYDINQRRKSEKEIRRELEIEIKQDIARKLFNFTDIDFDTIKKIVDLPRTALEKLR